MCIMVIKHQEEEIIPSIDRFPPRFEQMVDLSIDSATESNPANVLFIKNLSQFTSINFASNKSVEVILWVSNDRTVNATTSTMTGKWGKYDDETIRVNLENVATVYDERWYAILLQAYPSEGVSGEVMISAFAQTGGNQ